MNRSVAHPPQAGAPARPQMRVGDRLPDVRLQPREGHALTLHGYFAGAPLWLVPAAGGRAPEGLPPVPDGVRALCVGDAAPTALPPGWQGFAADPRWSAMLGADVLWQADSNLRLQHASPLPLTSPPERVPATAALVPAQTALIAPVLQVPAVFEPDLCAELVRHFLQDCGGGEASSVLVSEQGRQRMQLDPTIKQRRESPPRDPALQARMHERLLRRALPEIARVYQFQVQRRDPFKLLAYTADAGYFRPHRDNDTRDVAHRRFALSINLNAGDYEGGEFRYPEFGPHRFAPVTGTALVFSCSLLHEVLPVTRGTRYAMTTFLA